MRFRIENHSRAGSELGRVLRELALNTREKLEAFEDDPAECIHTLRRNLKKIRALLRLAKSELPEFRLSGIQKDTVLLKNSYARVRDQAVVVKVFRELARPGEMPELERLLDSAVMSVEKPGNDLIQVADRLVEEIAKVPFWAVTVTGVERAFKKSRHRAQLAGRRCHPDAPDEKFHAWRKCIKELSIQAAFLGSKKAKLANPLAEDLGDVNDLANLRHRLALENLPDALHHRIERNLAEARQKALHRGRKIY